MVPHLTIIEPFTECFFNVLIGSCTGIFIFGFSFIFISIGFPLLWFLFDMALLCVIRVSYNL